jgi:hypothetical protein
MRNVVAATLLVVGLVGAAACQSASDQPPPYGNCTPPPDGGKCTSPVTGGASSGGGDDGSTASCTVTGGSVACNQCAESGCCTEISTCEGDATCANLLGCEDACTANGASASCSAACTDQYPTAVSQLQQITSCISSRCTAACNQSGVGDPCTSGAPACVAGLACNGLWCSKACARSSDCTGIGANGDTIHGFPNACVTGPSGDRCAPECSSSVDCEAFPGSYCASMLTTEATTVSVCASLPDASTD